MVRSINSVKTDDSFYSFFIHVMIMQALSDKRATRSRAAGATTQPHGCMVADDAISRLPSVEVEFRMKECGRATRGVSRAEVLTR